MLAEGGAMTPNGQRWKPPITPAGRRAVRRYRVRTVAGDGPRLPARELTTDVFDTAVRLASRLYRAGWKVRIEIRAGAKRRRLDIPAHCNLDAIGHLGMSPVSRAKAQNLHIRVMLDYLEAELRGARR